MSYLASPQRPSVRSLINVLEQFYQDAAMPRELQDRAEKLAKSLENMLLGSCLYDDTFPDSPDPDNDVGEV